MARPVILVVDDDPGVRESFRLILEDDYEVLDVPDGPARSTSSAPRQVDLVLLDIRLPGMDGIEVLERIKALDERVEVILVTAVKTVRTAVAAMKLGAFDYLTKPFEEESSCPSSRRALERRTLEREVVFLRSELARTHDLDEIVGQHPAMRAAPRADRPGRADPDDRAHHGRERDRQGAGRAGHPPAGPAARRPFVAVNPAAIAETLLESELFGHERGAFTGAYQRKLGKFELAQGGTLFLDEIGALRPELQAKLLRVLQEREIERVGGTRPIKIDVRIIAATNSDLEARGRAAAPSGRTSTTGSTSSRSPCRRCASAPRTSRSWSSTSSAAYNRRVQQARSTGLVARGARRPRRPTAGPATCASSRTSSSGASSWSRAPSSSSTTCRSTCSLPEHGRAGAGGRGAARSTRPRDQFERQIVLRVLERVELEPAPRRPGSSAIHRNSLKVKLGALGSSRARRERAERPVDWAAQCASGAASAQRTGRPAPTDRRVRPPMVHSPSRTQALGVAPPSADQPFRGRWTSLDWLANCCSLVRTGPHGEGSIATGEEESDDEGVDRHRWWSRGRVVPARGAGDRVRRRRAPRSSSRRSAPRTAAAATSPVSLRRIEGGGRAPGTRPPRSRLCRRCLAPARSPASGPGAAGARAPARGSTAGRSATIRRRSIRPASATSTAARSPSRSSTASCSSTRRSRSARRWPSSGRPRATGSPGRSRCARA